MPCHRRNLLKLHEPGIGTEGNVDRGDAVVLQGRQTLRVPTRASPISDRSLIGQPDSLTQKAPSSARRALALTAVTESMPPANPTGMTADERELPGGLLAGIVPQAR